MNQLYCPPFKRLPRPTTSTMWNTPSLTELTRLPRLHTTKNIPTAEKVVGVHFFTPTIAYYMVEYCPKKQRFFGYSIVNFDFENSKWEYFSFNKMKKMKFQNRSHGLYHEIINSYMAFKWIEIEYNSCWTPKKIKDIPYIIKAHKIQGLDYLLKTPLVDL